MNILENPHIDDILYCISGFIKLLYYGFIAFIILSIILIILNLLFSLSNDPKSDIEKEKFLKEKEKEEKQKRKYVNSIIAQYPDIPIIISDVDIRIYTIKELEKIIQNQKQNFEEKTKIEKEIIDTNKKIETLLKSYD